MDEGRFSISEASSYARLGDAAAPLIADVRRTASFEMPEHGLVMYARSTLGAAASRDKKHN